MRSRLRLSQIEFSAAAHDFFSELDERFENLFEIQNFRLPVNNRNVDMPKDICSGVSLYSLLRTTCGTASRLSSMTTRMPSRFDSSRISEMPSSRFS
jgi:hypothetical protein